MQVVFKWNIKSTEKLIRTRHSSYFQHQFEMAGRKPMLMQAVWNELSVNISSSIKPKMCKTKYNSLYAIYKSYLKAVKLSGTDRVKWIYWDVFHNTLPKKKIYFVRIRL
ncbi:hypothetical protein CDIK_0706 [Cucumispora dikerogammari]|nr:hypothetical protein CDIK_0706 [Cucumispora dikerogammari]